MKNRIILAAVVVITVIFSMFTGCGNAQRNTSVSPSTVASEDTSPIETTAPAETTETSVAENTNQHICNFERYQEPLLDCPSEKWDGTGDEWEVLPYNTLDAISIDLFYRGFRELDYSLPLRDDSGLNRGTCKTEDVVYSTDGNHVQLVFTYITNAGTSKEVSSVWEFHAEHTGEFVDISGVGNPDPECIGEMFAYVNGVIGFGYSGQVGDGYREVELYYSPGSGNMYSYEYELTEEMFVDGELFEPGFLSTIDLTRPYVIDYPLPNPSTYTFSIKHSGTDEILTYTFKIGSTYKEWVYSRYNTDGWKVDPKDNTRIVSADGKYYITGADAKISRLAIAYAY